MRGKLDPSRVWHTHVRRLPGRTRIRVRAPRDFAAFQHQASCVLPRKAFTRGLAAPAAAGLSEDPWREAIRVQSSATGWDTWRHLQNWTSVLQTRLMESRGHFRPRFMSQPFEHFASLYDLTPMRRSLEALVDFGGLNSGGTRLTVATTASRAANGDLRHRARSSDHDGPPPRELRVPA